MRCEVVTVGTELLLGQIVNTNSAYIGDRLALAGIDCWFHTIVGDNEGRIAEVLRIALERNDAVLVCGGLGPTPDDVTREAIARALNVPLVRDGAMVANIEGIFRARQREMPENNVRQADRPEGATFIPQVLGTAPGLVCERNGQVLYALPGVPHEMKEMLERAVVPDLVRRAGASTVILSRLIRTWGLGESSLAQRIADRVDRQTNPTIAFLAQGVDGMNLRITAKAENDVAARRMLDAEEAELRALLDGYVFGVDDQTIERVVADLLLQRKMTLGVAESVTSGLVAARLAEAPGASKWFKGSVVAYNSQVKFDLLDVPEGPVVSPEAAVAMAEGAREKLRADVGMGVTGVAGPKRQEDKLVGTVFLAVDAFGKTDVNEAHFPGDRQHVRQFATITLLDCLRRRLLAGE